MKSYSMFINGQWIGQELPSKIEVNNPATNETIATVPKGVRVEAMQAVDAAHQAFLPWSKLTAYGKIIYQLKF